VVGGLTGKRYENRLDSAPHRYDMRTIHAEAWGRDGKYLESAEQSLGAIVEFARNWRRDNIA